MWAGKYQVSAKLYSDFDPVDKLFAGPVFNACGLLLKLLKAAFKDSDD